MKNRFLVALLILLNLAPAGTVYALDIPLLTWEQGKSQSVVLGGPTAAENWEVNLISESGLTLPLKGSSLNSAGFRVYTIDIPVSLATGRYSIKTKGPRSPENIVSQVIIVPAKSYEVPKAPYDLLFLMMFLGAFVSVAVSLRRVPTVLASYPHHLVEVERLLSGEDFSKNSRFIANFVERKRIGFLESLPESFLKSILRADSNFAHKLPGRAGIFAPATAVVLGIALFIGHEESGAYSDLGSIFLALLIAISSFDLFSGLLGAIAFLSMQVVFGGALDIRMALVGMVVAGTFLLPSLVNLASLLTTQGMKASIRATYYLFSILSVLYIPCSYLIVKSLSAETIVSAEHIPLLVIVALSSVYAKRHLFQKFLRVGDDPSLVRVPEKYIPRLFTNGAVLGLFLVLIVLYINWTENFTLSLLAATAWVAPFLLAILRLETFFQRISTKVQRLIWLEVGLVLLLIFSIFLFARTTPFLVEDLSAFLLAILAIPSILHALYVLIVTSGKVEVEQQ